jgi:hypothetical protein
MVTSVKAFGPFGGIPTGIGTFTVGVSIGALFARSSSLDMDEHLSFCVAMYQAFHGLQSRIRD